MMVGVILVDLVLNGWLLLTLSKQKNLALPLPKEIFRVNAKLGFRI
ncbi:MAG: hypothetical protein ABFS03_04425 [Chloroflexota bacterium]